MRLYTIALCRTGLFALCAVLFAMSARAQQTGSITGKLVLDEKTVSLPYGYAVEVDDVEGQRLGDLPQRYLVLQFTNSMLPADAVGNWAACTDLAKKDKLTAVEATIDPAKKNLKSLQLYVFSGPDEPANMSISLTGTPDSYTLADLKIDANQISGKLRTTAPQSFVHFKEGTKPEKFAFDVDFVVPIRHPKPVTAVLTAAQARSSLQLQTLIAFAAACGKSDFTAIRNMMTAKSQRELDELSKTQGKEKVLKLMKQFAPNPAVLRKQVSKIVVRGERATIVLKEEGGQSFSIVSLEKGAWKIDK